ncbi:hypothetical protein CPB83DRAFT_855263 [Crepidotus variabilis]|uniref:Uncharacterized protein n=1 Tax=Crepidotus variabilis TaxID=179855 RepID=A0A9P6JPU8_9AGAR|nr:hypothetical protein CPB83DRAFT_855263 [Crepidotus variabilis]
MADTVIALKGFADIIVGVILAFKPSIIYESVLTRKLHELSGLHLSNASVAPGFNHSIACFSISIGVGSVIAARIGKPARPVIFSMNITWALLSLLTCIGAPREWDIGSATLLMSALNHLVLSTAMAWFDPDVLAFGSRNREKKTKRA